MSNVTQQAVNLGLNVVDSATRSAFDVLDASVELAAAAATAPIRVGDKAASAVLDEARTLQAKALALLREVADAVTAPLP